MNSVIVVINKETMEPIKGAHVTLGFSWGMSKRIYTDQDGEAEIWHSSNGEAEVYINGDTVGTIQAPTRKKFYIEE